jgi:hypothetical protein
MKPRIRILLAYACLALFASVALAAGPAGVRKRAESSTLVTGNIHIERDGSVGGHSLDRPEQLHPQVVRLINQAAPHWRFEPVVVDGQPVRARAKMSVRVILNKQGENEQGEDQYRLRIGSASFGDPHGVKGETVTAADMKSPPTYPKSAWQAGIQGTVYLVLKIDREGKVVDAIDEQVNLTVLGSDQQMTQGRVVLARAARAAAKRWRYDVPVRGPQAGQEFWSVRVPVAFALCDDVGPCRTEPEYGGWQTYIPGPKNRVPWITEEESRAGSDALVAGEVHPVGSGPKLLTPPAQG